MALYAAFLAWRVGAGAGGADSSGYLGQARLLAEGRITAERRELPSLPAARAPVFAYVPLGFTINDNYQMVPVYPIGLPLLVAGAAAIVGWNAGPALVMWLHALTGVALMMALARAAGLPRRLALLGALLLAASPVFLFSSLWLMSDAPALVWTSAAIWLAWLAGRETSGVGRALGAGAALGLAVLIRPNNLLALAPVLVALGGSWRRGAALVAGGLPFAIAFAAHNRAAYGGIFKSGYGPMGHNFGAQFVGETLVHYGWWLPVTLTPLLALALALPWAAKSRPRWVALLAAWIVPYAAFYATYDFTNDAWWYLRFLLPSFPAWILAALVGADELLRRTARLGRAWNTGRAAPLTFALATCWLAAANWQLKSADIGRNEHVYRDAVGWAQAHLPPDAVLLGAQATGALYHYSGFTFVRSDFLPPLDVAALARIARGEGRTLVAMLFDFEEPSVLSQPVGGHWTQVGAVRHIRFWRLDEPRTAAVPKRAR